MSSIPYYYDSIRLIGADDATIFTAGLITVESSKGNIGRIPKSQLRALAQAGKLSARTISKLGLKVMVGIVGFGILLVTSPSEAGETPEDLEKQRNPPPLFPPGFVPILPPTDPPSGGNKEGEKKSTTTLFRTGKSAVRATCTTTRYAPST